MSPDVYRIDPYLLYLRWRRSRCSAEIFAADRVMDYLYDELEMPVIQIIAHVIDLDTEAHDPPRVNIIQGRLV